MRESFRLFLLVAVACSLVSCRSGAQRAATPVPESEQAIGESMKELYMAASAAAPQSPAQQKVIQRMAERASNGREVMLVMRAAVGVFPAGAALESQVRATVTAKMMDVATLDQLLDYAAEYPIEPARSRKFVERLFELGERSPEPRVWYRIRAAAFHLNVGDLGQQAQAKGDDLARR